MTTGKDLGYPEDHPFYDAEVISGYTVEQAIDDGIFIRLGPSLVVTTNFAHRVALAGPNTEEMELDADVLRQIVSGIVSEYTAHAYAVPKRADKHNEADARMACYIVKPGRGLMDEGETPADDEERAWVTWDGQHLTIMLPEDY